MTFSQEERDAFDKELEEMFKDNRTPEQKARSEGYAAGYKAAQEHYEHRAEYLESLKVSGEPVFLEILRNARGNEEVMTTEEACRVWEEMHMYMEGHPEGSTLLLLNDRLTRELAKGLRCGVCGAYSDPACVKGC